MYRLEELLFPFKSRFSLRFFADDDGGGGGGNDDKGDDDNKGGQDDKGKGGDDDKGGKKDDKKADDGLIPITVNGEERHVTQDELIKMASKSAGADAKFQEAAKARKEAEKGVKIAEILDRIGKADGGPEEDDLKDLAGLMGADYEELIEKLEKSGVIESTGGKTGGSAEDGKGGKKKKLNIDDLDEETAGILRDAQQRGFAETREKIKGECGKAIDKDKVLGKILDRADADKKDGLRSTLIEMVYKDIQRRVQAGEQYDLDLIADTVLSARTTLDKFGVSATPSKQSILEGLGPDSGGLPAEALSDEPVKRVASTDAKYADNFAARVVQKIRQSTSSSK